MAIAIPNDAWISRVLEALPAALPDYLKHQRWFAGKSDAVHAAEPWEAIPLQLAEITAYLFFIRVEYASGSAHDYALPVLPAANEGEIPNGAPRIAIPAEGSFSGALLYDALQNTHFMRALLEGISRGASFHGLRGELAGERGTALAELRSRGGSAEPSVLKVEQSNTSVRYGEQFMLKFFRRIEEGQNLDLEIGAFLTERARFPHSPPLAGAMEYRRAGAPPITLALLQGYVRNQGDAWRYTLQECGRYLREAEAPPPAPPEPAARAGAARWIDVTLPVEARDRVGPYLGKAALLGRRTAELHIALASDKSDEDFRPEPFTGADLREMSDAMTGLAARAFRLLRSQVAALTGALRRDGERALMLEPVILQRFEAAKTLDPQSPRTRVHGDYHLGQVLYTGDDFVIIDFEGEPEWPLAERRRKRSPLRDVAGMLRSFHYASRTAAAERLQSGRGAQSIERATLAWRHWVSTAFMDAYLATASAGKVIPADRPEIVTLLDLYLLEKSVYELLYELDNRPEWVGIPLNGILDLF